MNDLIESNLNDRSHSAFIEPFASQIENKKFGVPQGSILGPLLFLNYMNDIDTFCHHFHTILYADDTALINKRDNHTLSCKWLIENNLSLKTDKTKQINFTKSRKTNYMKVKMSRDSIENIPNSKY